MKKEGIEVLSLDVKKLLEVLNQALAEEWLAYYQYWVGAKVIEGPMRSDIQEEFVKHAGEELSHAEKVAERIIKLDGTPVLDPALWQKMARCKYEAPSDEYVESILAQNLRAERCAIMRYQEIADMAKQGNDYATWKMATEILEDELEHENDIVDFQKDIEAMKKAMAKYMK